MMPAMMTPIISMTYLPFRGVALCETAVEAIPTYQVSKPAAWKLWSPIPH